MVCSHCTLLHSEYAAVCVRCGHPLRPALARVTTQALENVPLEINAVSGVSLLLFLTTALLFPAAAGAALNVGAYLGIISITNIWLSVYRASGGEWLHGLRGLAYSAALLFSLISELARLQHLQALSLPAFGGLPASVPVPSALAAEMLAAALIVLDPLVVAPLIRWIEAGVERGEPDD